MDLHHKVWDTVDDRQDAYTRFLQALVRASEGGEEATQQVVSDKLQQLGCEVDVFAYQPRDVVVGHEFATDAGIDETQRTCVVGRCGGAGGGRSVIFFAHPDGEDVAGLERWQHAPFGAEIENGRLYGWGVADDLLGVAIMVNALDAVLAAGVRPSGDVILASTPSKHNARGVVYVLNQGYLADASVYLHPAESGVGLEEIKAFASGLLRFRIIVSGRPPATKEPTHTAFYHLAVDPIAKAMLVYDALAQLAARRAAAVHHPLLAAAVGQSTNLHVSHFQGGDENRLSRVYESCVLAGSATFPPGESVAQVQAQIEEAVFAAAQADDWLREHPPEIQWLLGINPAETPVDHPLYKAVSDAVQAVTGVEPHVNPLHSASDIRNPILHKGIPTVALGSLAGDLSQTGGHDEWVDLDDYVRAVKAVASVILNWCGVS